MEKFFIGFPFLFGLAASIFHVLSGPDHLAAVGPIALDNKLKSWLVGLSWGLGHITGMLIIGALFIFFKDYIPVEQISAHSEKIVGIMLLAIGVWAFYRLWSSHHKLLHSHQHMHIDENGNAVIHQHEHSHEKSKRHIHYHKKIKKQTYIAVTGIGIIHGLAGVSHFLGILPTLAFKTKFQSIMYLTGFSLGTIIAMVVFSVILGLIAKFAAENKKAVISNWINVIAGTAAIFVGIFWLFHN